MEFAIAAMVGAVIISAPFLFYISKKSAEGNTDRSQLKKFEEEIYSLRPIVDRATSLEVELRQKQEEITRLTSDKVRLETEIKKEGESHSEKIEEMKSVQNQIEKNLKTLTDELLKENSKQFLETAQKAFDEREKRVKEGVEVAVKPVNEALQKYEKQITEMEKLRKSDEGKIVEQLRSITETHSKLSDTTSGLMNSLKASPKTRGRWGEHQLRRILEMAGMMERVDFVTEHTIKGDEGRLRPDVVIHMPGNRKLAIDAKTTLNPYLEAAEEKDEEIQKVKLKEHAKHMRNHAMKLGGKDYWDHLEDSIDFVVMFVPGDNFYAAAMERDPDLFEDAYEKNVVIATPTTLLALAKAVAFGWRQESVSQEARRIHELGTELYKRMTGLGGKVAQLSGALNTTVKKHNELIGSLESNVMPQARKFQDMSVGVSHGEIAQLEHVESDVREARQGRDLEFASSEEDGPDNEDSV